MRKFRIYISHGCVGCPDEEMIIEMPDKSTEKEIYRECKLAWECLAINLDSGWDEITTTGDVR